jgi:hypothetical protein
MTVSGCARIVTGLMAHAGGSIGSFAEHTALCGLLAMCSHQNFKLSHWNIRLGLVLGEFNTKLISNQGRLFCSGGVLPV